MGFVFWNAKTAGSDFGIQIIQDHPAFEKLTKLNVQERIDFINKYVDDYYAKYRQVLTGFLKKFLKEWQSVEDKFYSEAGKIFKNHPWPKGLYICYLSIFNCNPRFLENKTFQAYYQYSYGIKYLIFHEMLHFMFYDYLQKNFSEEVKLVSEDKIWSLSEVFNHLILGLPDFMKLTQRKPYGYPARAQLTEKLFLLWNKTKEINLFLKTCFSTKLFIL